ncbi:hypothetical protein E4T56_gene2417 [Termitomyces sp. T112]|nr:hypothetical protein E4T56_gene2417 [Termitomyces sp. T112]
MEATTIQKPPSLTPWKATTFDVLSCDVRKVFDTAVATMSWFVRARNGIVVANTVSTLVVTCRNVLIALTVIDIMVPTTNKRLSKTLRRIATTANIGTRVLVRYREDERL